MKKIIYLLFHGFWSFLSLLFIVIILTGGLLIYLVQDLPDVSQLKEVQLQEPLRVYTYDGKLIGEYGEKRRIPIEFQDVPKLLIDAILATEDQRFYSHAGVDPKGLLRAAKQVIVTGDKQQGGSTITMQVARNFFLTREKTYIRKLKEILLAIKIDYLLDKESILELYLNKIYFGNRAYGIAAAANVYYGKSLSELTLAEMAMLAGLPKAPSAINPLANPQAALERRNHVLRRMYDTGYIDAKVYEETIHIPVTASYHAPEIEINAGYVGEMVRQAMVERFGEEAAYTKGFRVYSTVDGKLQEAATTATQQEILAYEERHGYRGPVGNLGNVIPEDLQLWQRLLRDFPRVGPLLPAVVINYDKRHATVMLRNGEQVTLDWANIQWARPYINGRYMGPKLNSVSDVLKLGDVIYIRRVGEGQWRLAQIPIVSGSLVALDTNNGAIKALMGGFDFSSSHFNRAVQAERQTGSSFKPFVYAAALAKGFTLASIINDAPIVMDDGSQGGLWRPQNVTKRFYGPTRLRVGLRHSRNLVTIRLLDQLGIAEGIEYFQNFGFKPEHLPYGLSLALGSGTTTQMNMAVGYAMFANGGYQIKPYVIDSIKTAEGEEIYKAKPLYACPACFSVDELINYQLENDKRLAPRLISPEVSYLITNVLQDAVQQGTASRAKSLNRPDLAGKTGTTNDQFDGWFAGYLPDLVAVAWMGFDQPRSIYEYGAQAALPMWMDFMKVALKDYPEKEYVVPPTIVSVKIDPETGLLATPDVENPVFEVFIEDTVPTEYYSQESDIFYGEGEGTEVWDEVF